MFKTLTLWISGTAFDMNEIENELVPHSSGVPFLVGSDSFWSSLDDASRQKLFFC